jgi:hypothetical protein
MQTYFLVHPVAMTEPSAKLSARPTEYLNGRRAKIVLRSPYHVFSDFCLEPFTHEKFTSGRRANGEALAPKRALCCLESRLPLFAILLTSTLSWAHHYSVNMAESNTTSSYETQYREAVALFDDPERCIEMAKLKLK